MAKKRQTVNPNSETAKPVNELDLAEGAKSTETRTPTTLFLKSEARKRRRRMDLRTLHGNSRAEVANIRAFINGEITMAEAEVRSRLLSRHRDTLTALTQSEQLASIQAQLERLQTPRGLPQYTATQLEDLPSESSESSKKGSY